MLENYPELSNKLEEAQAILSMGLGGVAIYMATKAGEAGMAFIDTYAVQQRGFVISAITAFGAHKDSKKGQS